MTPQPQHPTQAQIARLYTIGREAGLDSPGVKAELFDLLGLDSTKDLSPREYERFVSHLGGMARARRRPAAAQDDGRPKCGSRADCERLLRAEWPRLFALDADLAANLSEALDYFRLTRLSGRAAKSVLATTIQQLQKLDLRDLRAALGHYLTGYTSKPERYFLAMVRNAKRDRQQRERREKRHQQAEDRREQAARGRAQDVIDRAGEAPAVPAVVGQERAPAQASCPSEGREAESRPCPYCDGKSRLYWQPDEESPFALCPCPWCEPGRERLLAEVRGGKTYDHLNWPLIREQIEARLARRAMEERES